MVEKTCWKTDMLDQRHDGTLTSWNRDIVLHRHGGTLKGRHPHQPVLQSTHPHQPVLQSTHPHQPVLQSRHGETQTWSYSQDMVEHRYGEKVKTWRNRHGGTEIGWNTDMVEHRHSLKSGHGGKDMVEQSTHGGTDMVEKTVGKQTCWTRDMMEH